MRALWGAALLALLAPRDARAYHDPWTGPDKVLHFGAAGTIALGGYGLAAAAEATPGERLLIGGVAAGIAGLGKEGLDAIAGGDPSWKDLAWDGLGMLTGLVIARGVDQLVAWLTEEPPRP